MNRGVIQRGDRAHAYRNIRTRQVDVVLLNIQPDGGVTVGEPVAYREHNDEERGAPTFSLSFEAAQQLMDELWGQGIRPTEDVGSTGQLSAMKEHLKDLRRYLDHHPGLAP